MLPLLDAQVRLVLLHHIAVRLSEDDLAELHASGIETDQLTRLRALSPIDLKRLAGMHMLMIAVRLDSAGLNAGLRAVTLVNEAKELEMYFIRSGASWQMMNSLFKIRRDETLRRRRDCGAWRQSGRPRLPDPVTRQRIFRAWSGINDPNPRICYFQLHQTFPSFSLAVLETVVHGFEVVT